MKTVYIVDGNLGYHTLFQELGYTVIQDSQEADIVCFTGGADVSPEMYAHPRHPTTGNSPMRDLYESEIFRDCVQRKIPMVGICRG